VCEKASNKIGTFMSQPLPEGRGGDEAVCVCVCVCVCVYRWLRAKGMDDGNTHSFKKKKKHTHTHTHNRHWRCDIKMQTPACFAKRRFWSSHLHPNSRSKRSRYRLCVCLQMCCHPFTLSSSYLPTLTHIYTHTYIHTQPQTGRD
jgi:hypothetical protein